MSAEFVKIYDKYASVPFPEIFSSLYAFATNNTPINEEDWMHSQYLCTAVTSLLLSGVIEKCVFRAKQGLDVSRQQEMDSYYLSTIVTQYLQLLQTNNWSTFLRILGEVSLIDYLNDVKLGFKSKLNRSHSYTIPDVSSLVKKLENNRNCELYLLIIAHGGIPPSLQLIQHMHKTGLIDINKIFFTRCSPSRNDLEAHAVGFNWDMLMQINAGRVLVIDDVRCTGRTESIVSNQLSGVLGGGAEVIFHVNLDMGFSLSDDLL